MTWTDLAPGIHISEVESGDGIVAGWILEHERTDGSWCGGWIPQTPQDRHAPVEGKGPELGWNASTGTLAGGDLTIRSALHSSSIKCHTHPGEMHGFVTDGQWVPA